MMNDSKVHVELAVPNVAVGWIVARGCRNGMADEALLALIREQVARAVAGAQTPDAMARKSAVRKLLKHGVYRATGRGKPASEYLLNAAVERDFPLIRNLVDICNVASLEALLPASIVDLDKAGTSAFRVRHGREGEAYVFNASGQSIELRDLLLLSRLPADEPCANPVKDGQATKTDEGTRDCLGVVYAPAELAHEAEEAARRMAELMRVHAGATVWWGLLG